jgi:ectoine hydroxylase-related dioxygenase (phytanoyl-CoA dioxygenase family)
LSRGEAKPNRSGVEAVGHGAVDRSIVEAFRRDGAVPIRGLLSAAQVETLRRGIERNRAEPGPLAQGHGAGQTFFEDFCNWDRISEYETVIHEAGLGQLAASLVGAQTVRLFHDHVLVKEAGSEEPSPWHQDQPYYCVEGRQNVSLWIPVDPVGRENTLEFVAGSHASGTWYMPRTFVSQTALVFDEGELAEVPDIDAARVDHEILGWELQPGDAVAFHMLTLHQAGGSPTLRRAFSVRLLGDDARYAPRPHPTSPPFPGLERQLAPGDPFDNPRFPVLHPRRSSGEMTRSQQEPDDSAGALR